MLGPTDLKGAIAETAIIAAAVKLGIQVCRPVVEGGRYDLLFDFGSGKIERVQCKWAKRDGDVVLARARSSRRTATGQEYRWYTADEMTPSRSTARNWIRSSTCRRRSSAGAAACTCDFRRRETTRQKGYTGRRSTSSGL